MERLERVMEMGFEQKGPLQNVDGSSGVHRKCDNDIRMDNNWKAQMKDTGERISEFKSDMRQQESKHWKGKAHMEGKTCI